MTDLLTRLLDDLIWEPLETPEMTLTPSDVYVTHRGTLMIEQFEIDCYRCSNGEVAFDVEDMERFFRGCERCDHPSHCPGCNPTEMDRQSLREGIQLSKTFDSN